ncbi:MAG: hypothetical protein ACLFVO_10135 [Chloroflexaceae bacterium]
MSDRWYLVGPCCAPTPTPARRRHQLRAPVGDVVGRAPAQMARRQIELHRQWVGASKQ